MYSFDRQEVQELYRYYQQLLDRTLLLSVQEERELAATMQKANSEQKKEKPNPSVIQAGADARDRFIRANILLVAYVLKKFGHLQSMTRSDLLHEGVIGLIKAVDSFDLERQLRFDTFAIHVIKNTILSAIFEKDRLIRLPSYRENQLRDHVRKQESAKNAEVEQSIRICMVLSLDLPTDESNGTLAETLSGDDITEAINTSITHQELATTLLNILTPLERHISIALFIEESNAAEVARQLGVSRMRIIQRKQEILKKLRTLLGQLGITANDLFD